MDIDGTLVDSSGKIQNQTLDALIQLERDKNVKLILASGRNHRRLQGLAHQLKMDQYGGYFIEVDGIIFSDLENKSRTILHQMKQEEIKEIFEFLMTKGCEVQACSEQVCFSFFPDSLIPIKEKERAERNLPSDFPWTAGPWTWNFDMRQAYQTIHYVKNVNEIYGAINKLQVMDEKDNIQKIYEELNEKFNDKFEIFRTSYRQIEILPYGFSKGCTLKKIMEYNHWNKDEVIAFGDGENDVSLFDQVENSFAMGQAQSYVKNRARYETLSNNEEGIYVALKKLNLI